MSVVNIKATIGCDGCGCEFQVELDPALNLKSLPKQWTLFDEAVDAVRGGLCIVSAAPAHMRWANVGMCSVQNDKHLCPGCTRKADEEDDVAC